MGRLKSEKEEMSPCRLARDVSTEAGVTVQESVTVREASLQAAQIESLYQAGRGLESCSRILQEGVTSWL